MKSGPPASLLWTWGLKASALVAEGQPARAIPWLNRCARQGAGWALLLRARAKHALGRDDLAVADVTRAFDRDPHCAWIFGLAPSGRLPPGAPARRLQNENSGFARKRGCYAVRAFVGKLKIMSGRSAEGLDDLNWAVRASPRQSYLFAWRAETRKRLGQPRGAWRDVSRALALDRSNALALAIRAALRRRRGESAEALMDAARASRLMPRFELAPLEAARACSDLGDGPATLRWLERAVRRSARLGWRNLYEGPPTPARVDSDFERLFNPARGAADERGRVLAWIGEAALSMNSISSARAALRKAVDLAPSYAWGWAWLGESLTIDDPPAALRALDCALRLDPRYPRAYNARGELHLRQGRAERALRDLDASLRLDPLWALSLCRRAQAHLALGRTEAALEDLTASLRLDPGYAQALELRRRLS